MANRSLGQLTLDLIARVGGFQKGMDQAARIADQRSRTISRAFSGMGRAITGIFAGISAGFLVRKVAEATAEAETALAELESALEATGGAAGFSADQLTDFAGVLQNKTRFDDEAIVALQTTLLRFGNVVGEEFTRATELSLDLATALKIDLPAAGKLLGQALDNPVRGITRLRKAGVELDDSQVKLVKRLFETGQVAEAQGILLDALSRIQGRAAASADTFGGALQQVKNAWDDLFEVTGEGSNDAKEALQEFRDLLADPDTKEGAQILAQGIIKFFGWITSAISDAAKMAKFFGEEWARMRGNIDTSDPVGIQRAIDQIEDIKRTLFTDPLDRLRFFGKDGLVEWYSDADLERELARLKRQLAASEPFANPVLDASGRPVSGATQRRTTPEDAEDAAAEGRARESEFQKIKARLEEQAGLYGLVGEAAKIRYQVENDLIEGLTEAQGQQLIRLAETYDAQVAAADATKLQAEAQKALRAEYESQSAALVNQIALNGELSELERVRYDIAYGSLKGINEEEAKRLEALAAGRDAQIEANKEIDAARGFYEATRTPLEVYIAQLEEIVRLRDEGAFDTLGGEETVARAAQQAADDFKNAVTEVNTFTDQAKRNMQDILGDFLSDPFGQQIDDVLADFGRMLAQMAAQAIAADIASKIFGDGSSNLASTFGSFITGLFSRDSGGRGSPGQSYVIGTGAQPELFIPDRPGTFVPNADRMQRPLQITQQFSISAPGGSVSRATQVQIAAAAARGAADASRRNN